MCQIFLPVSSLVTIGSDSDCGQNISKFPFTVLFCLSRQGFLALKKELDHFIPGDRVRMAREQDRVQNGIFSSFSPDRYERECPSDFGKWTRGTRPDPRLPLHPRIRPHDATCPTTTLSRAYTIFDSFPSIFSTTQEKPKAHRKATYLEVCEHESA